MEWFRWWHGTLTDPKFQWVARKSGQSFTSVIALWVAILERASNVTQGDASVTRGDLAGFDCDDYDVLFGLEDGSCAAIFASFETKGLITEGAVTNWEKRQPKREDSSAARTREYRARKSQESSVTGGDADVTQCDGKSREDKSREDKKETTPSAPIEKISLDAGEWSSIPDALWNSWEAAYPAVNLDSELAKAAAWLMANPKNKKSNYARFLTSWLTRAQDGAPRAGMNGRDANNRPQLVL